MRSSQNLDKLGQFFAIARLEYFSCLFLFLFPCTFTLATRLDILSGCRKTLGLNYGTMINYRHNGPFYYHFRTKTDSVVFQFAAPELECYPYPKPLRRYIYPCSNKCLLKISIRSHFLERALSKSTRICCLGVSNVVLTYVVDRRRKAVESLSWS